MIEEVSDVCEKHNAGLAAIIAIPFEDNADGQREIIFHVSNFLLEDHAALVKFVDHAKFMLDRILASRLS